MPGFDSFGSLIEGGNTIINHMIRSDTVLFSFSQEQFNIGVRRKNIASNPIF